MPKILHTYRYTGRPWEILKSVVPDGFYIKTLDEPTLDLLIKEVKDADYLLVSGRLKIDKEVLENAKKLKMIQRTGVGTDMLDLDEISKRDIPVYVNAGVNARSVAEHTLTLILSCLKRVTAIDQQVKNGIWKKQDTGTSCRELFGKTVGLVGMGAIGRLVSRYLECFGAKILYTDPYRLDLETEKLFNVTYVASLKEMLPQVDILSLHCPLTDSNRNLINAEALEMMRDGVVIVNTARGGLIDEDALYAALKDGKVSFAGLDVYAEEPIKKNDTISKLDNVILSPHIAGLSFETFSTMMKNAIENIVEFDRGNLKKIEPKKLMI